MQHNIDPLLLPYSKLKGGYESLYRLSLAFDTTKSTTFTTVIAI